MAPASPPAGGEDATTPVRGGRAAAARRGGAELEPRRRFDPGACADELLDLDAGARCGGAGAAAAHQRVPGAERRRAAEALAEPLAGGGVDVRRHGREGLLRPYGQPRPEPVPARAGLRLCELGRGRKPRHRGQRAAGVQPLREFALRPPREHAAGDVGGRRDRARRRLLVGRVRQCRRLGAGVGYAAAAAAVPHADADPAAGEPVAAAIGGSPTLPPGSGGPQATPTMAPTATPTAVGGGAQPSSNPFLPRRAIAPNVTAEG